jgi:hypothetical protein
MARAAFSQREGQMQGTSMAGSTQAAAIPVVTPLPPPESVDAEAERQANELLRILSIPDWQLALKFLKPLPRDAELRKLLGRIYWSITEFQRLKAGSGLAPEAHVRAHRLLQVDPLTLSVDAVLEVTDAWDQLLIEYGDERYLRGILVAEHTRDPQGTTVTTWSSVFHEHEVVGGWEALLKGEPMNEANRTAAANQLAELYRVRSILYQLARARMHMRARHLWLLVPMLAPLIVGLSLAAAAVGAGWGTIWLVALAGALGASVAGTLKLRDHITNINELRAFWPATVVQPLIGSTAGLLTLLVLASGLIKVDWGGQAWAVAGAIAFVAGFSEPVFLGIIGRVAAIGEPSEKAANPPSP